ncbi:MAG: hypothetical protein MJZ19_10635, partial [Paludibacteraceae bacterium]|nr:hypothetical protein [Paludibacteraceae bacterium]
MNNTYKSLRTIIACFGVLFSCNLSISAQDCESVLGWTDFEPSAKNSHDTITFYSLDGMKNTYPSGALADAAGTNVIDSLPQFSDGKSLVWAVTSNPSKLNSEGKGQFADIDEDMLVIQCATEPMSKLFEYSVFDAKPGTTYKVKATLYNIMDPDSSIAQAWPTYDGYNPYQLVVGKPQPYGKDMESVTISSKQQKVEVTYEGEVGPNESSITFGIWAAYNCLKNISLGIGKIEIIGCLNPRIKSGQGTKICRGEQTSLTLDRDYNAKSYKWEKSTNGGASWEVISTKQTALDEVNNATMYRCFVDGEESNVITVEPETCCEVNGKPASRKTVFHEDFGYFKNSRTYVNKDGDESSIPATNVDFRTSTGFNIPKHTVDLTGQINDDTYAVVVPTENGYALQGNGQFATWMNGVTKDHSSEIDGRDNSACLFINVNKTIQYKGPVFEDKINGLCKNKELYFECYIANMSGGENPYVTIKLLSTDGKELGVMENVEATAGGGWIPIKIQDIVTPETSVILQVIADCGTKCQYQNYWEKGNDLAIDDIKFMTCSPPSVSAYLDMESLSLDTTVCSDVDLKIEMPISKLLDDYFGGGQHYVLQCSADGKTWKHVSTSLSSIIKFNSDDMIELYPDAKVIYARVIVASQSAAQEFEANPNLANADDDCNDYSISDPFTITIDCPTCTKSEEINIESTAEIKIQNKLKYVYLCPGESTTLSAADVKTLKEDKSDIYDNFTLTWYADDVEVSHVSQTSKAEDITVSYDDVTEKGVEYKLQSFDYDYPGQKDCMQEDIVIVARYPEVTKTLTDPDPFCEGLGAGKVVSTISGYKIHWFEDADTLKSLKADVPGSWFEGKEGMSEPYEYYYYLEDTKSHCIGEVNKFTVDVREIPEAPNDTVINMVVTGKKEQLEEWDVPEELTQLFYDSKTSTSGTETYPLIDRTKEGTVTVYRTFKSKGGCESEKAEVRIEISAAPDPNVKPYDVCEGKGVDAATIESLVEKTKDFELVWYTDKDADKEDFSTEIPSLSNATVGEHKIYVANRGVNEPNPISEKSEIVITCWGVKDPVVKPLQYCAEDEASELEFTKVVDVKNYYDANGFIWSSGEIDLSPNRAPTPDTKTLVEGATTVSYDVRQTLELKYSKDVCEGNKSKLDITITRVLAPDGELNVSYVKSEGEALGKFTQNLVEKNPNVVKAKAGHTLLWSAEKDGTYKATVPTPLYKAGSDKPVETETYWARWQDDASGCMSDPTEIVVTITSTPSPKPAILSYCEGEDPTNTELGSSTTVNTTNLPNPGDYSLYWFRPQDKSIAEGAYLDRTGAWKSSASPANTAPTPSTYTFPANSTETVHKVTYYVVQSDIAVNPAGPTTSPASEITLMFYAKPRLAITNPKPVCEKTVDLTAKECWIVE